ncbi:MAG TPA: class I SAM-dependent methyltransferase, partial [Chitinophagaceae bacterium]|nr:class I SAM-dependent methyltransferase [Chitinophagaceae bacterium]
LAKGLTDDGQLHTIELRENDAATAKGFFDRSAYKEKIILHTGDAKKIVSILDETFDLVFIDADKSGYIEYFNLVFPKLRKNGFIFADNIFFHGQAIENEPSGKNGKAIKAFNQFINERSDIEKMILTLRDGLYLIRKK